VRDFFDLSGKYAVITGGGGLLGHQHARALLAKNCSVELWDNNSLNLNTTIRTLKEEFPASNIDGFVVDISNEELVEEAVRSTLNKNKYVDILINNAAVNPKFDSSSQNRSSRVENYDLAFLENEFKVGLIGAFVCSKIVGSTMKSKGGVILNISSDLSVISPDQRIYFNSELDKEDQFVKPISYSMVKTGLIGMTRYLATYWPDYNIRVNALSPGGVFDNQNRDFVETLISRIPLGRMANKDDYIGAIQFLCSDASAYMTGQNVVIDGGRSIW